MRAPHGAEFVVPGQRRVGILRHVGNGKIVGHERVGQATEGEDQKTELAPRRRTRQAHPQAVAAPRADQRNDGLHQRKAQCQNHGQMAEFGNHRSTCLAGMEAGAGAV